MKKKSLEMCYCFQVKESNKGQDMTLCFMPYWSASNSTSNPTPTHPHINNLLLFNQ